MKQIADLKKLIADRRTLGRKTIKIDDVERHIKDIGVSYAQTSNKYVAARDDLKELRKEMEELMKLNAALGMRLGYKMMSEEDKNRIMGRTNRDVKRIAKRKRKNLS